ncbi:MAG TPA: pyridoxamine 5'-phosphate oxidase family protein [Hyphomonadaceae bacterium]|nr:pyridoxamine 5'-phosphate oxidase family protein [Hyphomonadaceae bacterium]HPI49221.1 pyridoxamine 5'-phosphate oxidase family protein [Hyphomonadaceae bacterium]
MTHKYLSTLFTDDVKAAQAENGSRAAYARFDGPAEADELTEAEADFIAVGDSFYMATVSENGWPYIQHRGGPAGFLKMLDTKTLAFADFRGNRQYISVGNIAHDDRVSLFLMDYPRQARLKILGRMQAVDLADKPELAASLATPGHKAKIERALVIKVEAFDWNCPQHITQRFTLAEIEPVVSSLRAKIADLEAKLAERAA